MWNGGKTPQDGCKKPWNSSKTLEDKGETGVSATKQGSKMLLKIAISLLFVNFFCL